MNSNASDEIRNPQSAIRNLRMDSHLRPVSLLLPVPEEVGETFTYLAAPEVRIGERVEVFFGRRKTLGYVVGEAAPYPGAREIEGRVDGVALFPPAMIELTRWMGRRWCAPWYRCMEAAVPSGLKMKAGRGAKTRRVLEAARPLPEMEGALARDERLLSAVRWVAEHPASLTIVELASKMELNRGRIETLVRKGWLRVREIEDARDPFAGYGEAVRDEARALTDEQSAALELAVPLGEEWPAAAPETLLFGVTGSGKTEVYLQAIARARAAGRSAIVLVPEISLTPQTVDRFRARFGREVAVLHSALSEGERFDEWMRIRRGGAQVVIGARSAVFAPVERLGLIVIDEAHESSYKQSDSPRYHAVDVARKRCALEGARLCLGTATPTCEQFLGATAASPESPLNNEPARPDFAGRGALNNESARSEPVEGRARLARLTHRIESRPLPTSEIVDMRMELAEGHRSIFSRRLIDLVRGAQKRGEQTILFLNRRGHASFVLCRSCGEPVRCPLCAVSLTVHQGSRSRIAAPSHLVCHFCNHRSPMPHECPACGSRAIKSFGAGTERIEEEAKKTFAGARVARMDADTTVRKGSHRTLLGDFAARKYDILVGTQMIGKGLDLPGVTVVGLVAADSSLHLPDFRAGERTFDLIVQVTGRAGRAEKPGIAIIQTYAPAHPAIVAAARHDVEGFLEGELKRRCAAGLPPYTRMVQWTWESEREETARDAAVAAASALEGRGGLVGGPAPAPLERLRGRHRWQVRWQFDLDTADATVGEVVAGVRAATVPAAAKGAPGGVRCAVDIDPLDLL
jgi:primosomal protein N' (replication factor Y)